MQKIAGLAPNLTPILTTRGVADAIASGTRLVSLTDLALQFNRREIASDFAMPTTGTSPGGIGFNFGDTFRRTGKGSMEFAIPTDQTGVMRMSLRLAQENVFIGKGMRVRTDFTCKGLRNATKDEGVNAFFDSVIDKLNLHQVYRDAMYYYYTVGLAPIVMSPPDEALTYIDVIDPVMVRTFRAFGKVVMYMCPDRRMLDACRDPKGTTNPMNRDYYEMMPKSWREQLTKQLLDRPHYNVQMNGMEGEILIRLDPGSFIAIENRYIRHDLGPGQYSGAPLANYFAAAEKFAMNMRGDFASALVAKNLLALVSIDDPETEKENWQRPDDQIIAKLASSFGTPNQAQYMYGPKSLNVRYLTPSADVWTTEKYKMDLEILKNLLPSPFWYNAEGGGAFASATIEIRAFREEIGNSNTLFDREFWTVLYERAANQSAKRIPAKLIKPPVHDKNSLVDDVVLASNAAQVFGNGGLDMRTYLEDMGYDYETIKQRKLDELPEIKRKIWVPAFESKQGITAEALYALTASQANAKNKSAQDFPPPAPPAAPAGGTKAKTSGSGGKGGRPASGGTPTPERGSTRTPRPGGK